MLKNACATIAEKWTTSFHSSSICRVNRPIAESAAVAISESIFIKTFSNCYFMPHWSESILSNWARKSWPCKWQRSSLRVAKQSSSSCCQKKKKKYHYSCSDGMAFHILLPPLSPLPPLLSTATLEAEAVFKSPKQTAYSLAKIKLQ